MGLEFNYDLPVTQVIEKIKNCELDKDIRDYILELKDMNEIKRDIKEYFELNCLSERNNETFTTVGAPVDDKEYEYMNKAERLLHNEFQLRILMVYNELKEV